MKRRDICAKEQWRPAKSNRKNHLESSFLARLIVLAGSTFIASLMRKSVSMAAATADAFPISAFL